MAGEYKQVTVLFADVVRSSHIAAALDIERLRELMAAVVERMAAVVKRYGGTVEYNGDGIMALFGAPITLEDHAFRGCLAAMAIQAEMRRLGNEVRQRDGVALQLRVGLNSGRVIVGDFGSGLLGYRATGEPVAMAQRMESVAPPGGVMVSEATAQLVAHLAELGDQQLVHIKGADAPVAARQLMGVRARHDVLRGEEFRLVGRSCEMASLDEVIDRAVLGRGTVVEVVAPAGIGKSRVARETAARAAARGVRVFWTFCESHARDIPFRVVAGLLREEMGVCDLDDEEARARVRARVPDADPHDLRLLEDLLGVADLNVPLTQVDPDARRRRLTALVRAMSLTRSAPVLFVVEDLHWIDAASESLLADFFAALPEVPAIVMLTYRPEYAGSLAGAPDTHRIALALAPLDDSDTAELIGGLLGTDPSVGGLAAVIVERASGNPFFAEEMVRELSQRGVLTGPRGQYTSGIDATEVAVPATVQAAIAARIDRLDVASRHALNAASVIGVRFGADLLGALGVEATFEKLVGAELVDQVSPAPNAQYAFRHPLIRAVAYESQLRSDRARWHRKLAAVVESGDPAGAEENAALIAEHLESAGEMHAAYGWHMRAAAWSANRDIDSARISWERARRIADQLPTNDSGQLSMRIAPRAMLCATDYQNPAVREIGEHFAQLRELCGLTGDKASLAIGMSGLAIKLQYTGRSPAGVRLVAEQIALLESIGDTALTMGLSAVWFNVWGDAGEFDEILRWSQIVIDLAGGDPAKGRGFGLGSPLAIALAWRGNAGWWLGRPGWRQDLREAVVMARISDPTTFSAVVAWIYNLAMDYGALHADDATVRVLEEAARAASASPDIVLRLTEYTLSIALLCRGDGADRDRGLDLMTQFREFAGRRAPFMVPVTELWIARESFRGGERDDAIAGMREAVAQLHQAGRLGYGVWGTGVLIESLLNRGGGADLAEASDSISWLAGLPGTSAVRDITLLRLRTLLARASGDTATLGELVNRYRDMATAHGFEGHRQWADAIAAGE